MRKRFRYEQTRAVLKLAESIEKACGCGIMLNKGYIQDPETGRMMGSTGGGSGGGGASGGSGSLGKKNMENAFRNGINSKSSKEIVNTVIENHESLAEFTPKGMKLFLENCGYDVKPLGSKSSLKGQQFEDGGGYRISFGGDGYFQYHPQKASHHKNAYWKIGNGERGLHRYEMDGTIKND